ncbi:MAG TPA: hypothetical protein P5181_09975 [Dermatophilaceae bacterium]|nr:hypothetical protein [Dermatophilaceae bacterium]
MVALLVRLKLSLLRTSLQRSVWRTVGIVIGAAYGLGVAVLAIVGQAALRFAAPEYAAPASVVGLSALTLGWMILPILTVGFDDTIEPGRFALLPVRARELLPGLVLAALIGIPGVVTVIAVLVGQLVVWSVSLPALLAALVCVPLGLVTCVLLSRLVVTAAGAVFGSRRFREIAMVVFMLLVSSIGIVVNLASAAARSVGGQLTERLVSLADVLGWSPLGAAWSVPGEVAAGRWGSAGGRLVVALVVAALAARLWELALSRALTSPLSGSSSAAAVASHGWLDRVFGSTPTGAVAARALRYWRRDPRYLSGGLSALVMPLIIGTVSLTTSRDVGGPGLHALYAAPLILGIVVSATTANDLSYDGSAVWTHVTAGVSGRQDRLGRVLVNGVLGLLVGLVFLGIALGVTRDAGPLPAALAATLALLLGGLAAGTAVGAAIQVPAVPAGANPFRTRSGGGAMGLASAGLTLTGTVVLALPGLVLAGLALWRMSGPEGLWVGLAAVLGSAAAGCGVLWLAIVKAGEQLDRTWPEVLARVSASDE